ncbi:MAG: hypothetical protein ACRECA_00555 [Pseudolabrys sp.]
MRKIILAVIALLSISGAASSEDVKCDAMIEVDALWSAAQQECGISRTSAGRDFSGYAKQCAGRVGDAEAKEQRKIGETKFASQLARSSKDGACAEVLKNYSRNLIK